jgi:hypothetical protein
MPMTATGHHVKKSVPKTTVSLYQGYSILHAKAKVLKGVSAGRNVAVHGHAKDGKKSHELVRREFIRLWRELHPAAERSHRRRQEKAEINRLLRNPTPTNNRSLARYLMLKWGFSEADFACVDRVVMGESSWVHTVWNRQGSGAYGIPQALPGYKMASAGSDWATNPATQIRWMVLHYMVPRYGSPCGAWAFKSSNGWY